MIRLRSRTLSARVAEAEKLYTERRLATDDVRGLEEMVSGTRAYFGYGWRSTDRAALRRAVAGIRDVIGPVRGRPAYVDPDGRPVPAAGDPRYWYVRFRHPAPAKMPAGVEEATATELDAVCGAWAA